VRHGPDPFKYIPPDEESLPHFKAVAEATLFAYNTLLAHCPRSAERTLAIRQLQLARMWANAAISFKGEAIET
jgi:hypothetical protein